MMPGNNRKEVNGGGTKVEELDFRNNFMGNDSATDLASLLGANRCHLFVTSAALHLWEGTNQFPNPGCWCVITSPSTGLETPPSGLCNIIGKISHAVFPLCLECRIRDESV